MSNPRSALQALCAEKDINLADELRLYDPFNHGTIEKIDLMYLLKDIGLDRMAANRLITELAAAQ
jgi:hypothetical protein